MNYENFTVSNIKYAYTCCCRICAVYVQTVQYLQGVTLHSLQCLNFTQGTELRHTLEKSVVKRSLRAEGPNTTEHSEGHGEGKEGDMLPHQRDKPCNN